MENEKPSVVVLRSLLSACRDDRIALTKKQDWNAHIRNFPVLGIENLVS